MTKATRRTAPSVPAVCGAELLEVASISTADDEEVAVANGTEARFHGFPREDVPAVGGPGTSRPRTRRAGCRAHGRAARGAQKLYDASATCPWSTFTACTSGLIVRVLLRRAMPSAPIVRRTPGVRRLSAAGRPLADRAPARRASRTSVKPTSRTDTARRCAPPAPRQSIRARHQPMSIPADRHRPAGEPGADLQQHVVALAVVGVDVTCAALAEVAAAVDEGAGPGHRVEADEVLVDQRHRATA